MPRSSADRSIRPLILIGPTPPPIHGSAFATKHLIEAVQAAGLFAGHLETGEDDRDVFTLGAFDPINVYLGIKHVLLLLLKLIRHPGADVHVPISQNRWGFARDGIFIWLAWIARRGVIVHLYGGLFGDFYASSGRFERRWIEATFRRVSQAWVDGPNRLGIFEGLLDPGLVRVLENTAEDQRPGLPARDGQPPLRPPGERLKLLFLANLIPEKGHGELLDALELLAARGSAGFDLRLIGAVQAEEAQRIRARATELAQAGTTVELHEPVLGPEKHAHYEWADAFVLPSRYPPEGQPLVIIEAMSASIPVIATDHSAIPFTVLDGEQGLIVPKGDVEALAAALERLRDDPALCAELGRSGRERYDRVYGTHAFAARVAERLADR